MDSSNPPPYTLHPDPPTLPPRNPSTSSASSSQRRSSQPQTYLSPNSDNAFLHAGPRWSSSASLPSAEEIADPSSVDRKRKLLLIYIHGFMGDETSFRDFPLHVHNLLTVTLGSGEKDVEGYLVHTKVYPKFKTRHDISNATEGFSIWLSRFESVTTDIILLGHSMGGILAAEVVLLTNPQTGLRKHPGIVGIISFDTPFLGLHPGIIVSGIGSLFRKSPTPSPGDGVYEGGHGSASGSTMSLATSEGEGENDGFFNRRPKRNFTIAERKKDGPWWESPLHFIEKHHDNIVGATGKYFMSHLQFGSCLADPQGLKNRYTRIRKLEDGQQDVSGRMDRARFINYYTASTGRIKTPSPKPEASTPPKFVEQEIAEALEVLDLQKSREDEIATPIQPPLPPLNHPKPKPDAEKTSNSEMQHLSSEPMSEAPSPTPQTPTLSPPPPPQPPQKPEKMDLSHITDLTFLKSYEKQFKVLTKQYERATKAYEKAMKEHSKLLAKWMNSIPSPPSPPQVDEESTRENTEHPLPPPPQKEQKHQKPLRERRFCILPWEEDKKWIKVNMVGFDEVGAHCGLFFGGEVYERLVGDVVGRVEEWLGEDRSRRVVEEWGG